MTPDKLLADAMADRDIDGAPGVGAWQVSAERIVASGHPDGEVMIGRSVRMPLETYERIRAVALSGKTSVSRLIREWIDEGLAQAEAGVRHDPVVELRRTIDAATRALRALEDRGSAA
jgi:hypothetical protein